MGSRNQHVFHFGSAEDFRGEFATEPVIWAQLQNWVQFALRSFAVAANPDDRRLLGSHVRTE